MGQNFTPWSLISLFTTIIFVVLTADLVFSNEIRIKSVAETNHEKYLQMFLPHKKEITDWLIYVTTDKTPKSSHSKAGLVNCDICLQAYPALIERLQAGISHQEIIEEMIQLCVAMEVSNQPTCDAAVRSYGPPMFHIIEDLPDRTMEDVCGMLNPGCTVVNENLTNWQIILDQQKPPVQTLPPLPDQLDTVKILQLTDIHLDLNYTANCPQTKGYFGCETESSLLADDCAGPYGHYQYALPPLAYDAMLEHAKTAHGDIKYVFLTGDFMHNSWGRYSQVENTRVIKHVTEILASHFPSTPIYPLSGNHDTNYLNMYPPQKLWDDDATLDLTWMYGTISAPFTNWLGPDQLATFKKGGYYTLTPEPGLRLVVLNTNLCYLNNFWLSYDPIDPEGQLQWLAETMLEAEQDGENVLILGHIPPGSRDCWSAWSQQFDRIVQRFENIIRAQFYGHEHTEYLNIAFEPGTERPLPGLTFVGPSALEDVGRSSGYKVYHVDGARGLNSTWEIVDHETWVLNTTMANEANEPIFHNVYTSARAEFGLESIRGDALYNLVIRMLTDDDLYMKFQRQANKGFYGGPYEFSCDPNQPDFQECKLSLLCICVTSNSANKFNCEQLRNKL